MKNLTPVFNKAKILGHSTVKVPPQWRASGEVTDLKNNKIVGDSTIKTSSTK